jgi:alkylation response protein AidB-like acyl-CoA dehydrogenase
MADTAVDELETFRAETRSWLEENCPPSMRTPMKDDEIVWGGKREKFKNPESKVWLERMAEKGWTAPQWPKKYGGGGLSPAEARVLQQEMSRIKARQPLFSFGLWMFGPAGVWQRRTENALHSGYRPWPYPLVPGLFRAGRGL